MIFRNHFPAAILIYYRQLAKSRCYATIKQRCTHTQIFTQNEATNQNETKNDSHNPEVKYFMFKFGAALGFTTVLLDLYKNYFNDDKRTLFTSFFKFCKLEQKDLSNIRENASDNLLEPPERSDLRIISLDEVKQHGRDASRIWVIYKRGVYDITDFVVSHPGGDKILLAAGGSIEPFWTIYAQHKTNDVMEMLEEMRIGSLTENDICLLESKQNLRTVEAKDDPFHNDPLRHPALLINSQKPFNAETPPSLLVDSFITPNELFFVRNHMPVPELDENTHRIEVGGVSIKHELSLSVTDLKNNFEKVTIVSSLQCAGNRRKEMNIFKKVQGLMWTGTAISNAKWTGCRLRDVLISAGVKPEDKNIRHIQLEGADTDSNGGRYGASIPFEKAMSPEVIIAYEMNDKPIPKDHGYPLRLIVPGIVGARQVKWLSSIRTSTEESGSHWQRNDYKALPNSVETSDPSALNSTPSIQDCPVQSVICAPAPNIKISSDSEKISVNGYAWSGGGRGIIRVEVSCDGGETWKCAQLQQCPGQDLEHMWAWTLWNIDLEIPKHAKKSGILELVCKATDRAYNTQPETSNGIWNVRGLLYNARHRIQIKIE